MEGLESEFDLDCPPWGKRLVTLVLVTKSGISDEIQQEVAAFIQKWPAIWELGFEGFKEILEEYGYFELINDHKINIKTRFPVPSSTEDPVMIALSFEPYLGFYDVTIQNGAILDAGAAF